VGLTPRETVLDGRSVPEQFAYWPLRQLEHLEWCSSPKAQDTQGFGVASDSVVCLTGCAAYTVRLMYTLEILDLKQL